MRLARHHDLHRLERVVQQLAERGRVVQHQRQPLVGGHPPGEPDREHVLVEHVVDPGEFGPGGAALPPGGAQPAPGLGHQPGAQQSPGLPQLAGRGGGGLFPVTFGENRDLGRHPGGGVHAVGDRADGHLAGVEARPEPGEHLPAHLAVQQRDAVDPLGQPHAHHGHVEHLGVAARVGLRAEREHPLDGQQRVVGEDLLDQAALEPVDARGDRGVRGEDRARPADLEGLVEAEPLLGVLADALQAEEPGVALVGVEDLGRRVPAQRAEGPHRAHPAHAEQQFLAQPVVAAAAVQPVGDLVQVGLVLLHVGVEQQQRHPADLGHPDLRGELPARGQVHLDVHRRAGGVPEQLQGQAVRVVGRVPLGLPAVGGQRLGEVAVPVQQADPDQRHAQVAGRLQVVAGQDAQAAGVLRQRGGDAVLGREVRDRGRGAVLARVPARLGHVPLQVLLGLAEPAQEIPVRRERGDPGRRQRAEHGDRVAARRRPGGGIDRGEQVSGRAVPGPAEVEHEAVQRGQRLGQGYADSEPANRFHGQTLIGPGQ